MKKIVICNVTMRENVVPLVYQSQEPASQISKEPVIYPVLAYLAENLNPQDQVKIILLCKCDPRKHYLRNIQAFKDEFERLCSGCSPEYQVLDADFDEEKLSTEQLLEQIVSVCEDGSELIGDITYGTKVLPVVMLAALGFAAKQLGCKVSHVFYGQVYFQDNLPTDPKLKDLSYLIYLNSLIATLECKSPRQARETLSLLLKL